MGNGNGILHTIQQGFENCNTCTLYMEQYSVRDCLRIQSNFHINHVSLVVEGSVAGCCPPVCSYCRPISLYRQQLIKILPSVEISGDNVNNVGNFLHAYKQ